MIKDCLKTSCGKEGCKVSKEHHKEGICGKLSKEGKWVPCWPNSSRLLCVCGRWVMYAHFMSLDILVLMILDRHFDCFNSAFCFYLL